MTKLMTDQLAPLDRRRRRLVAQLTQEKRRNRRVNVQLEGRYMIKNGWEFPCSVRDISPGGVLLDSEYPPRGGKQVVLMIAMLGRLEGEIVRTTKGGFVVALHASSRKRDRLGDALTWLLNKDNLGLEEVRRSRRSRRRAKICVQTADGLSFLARSLDVSITGMAIESKARVRLGEQVRVGRLNGTVVRHIDQGFVVCFDPPAARQESAGMGDRPAAPPASICSQTAAAPEAAPQSGPKTHREAQA